jgi:hypothetical protein
MSPDNKEENLKFNEVCDWWSDKQSTTVHCIHFQQQHVISYEKSKLM